MTTTSLAEKVDAETSPFRLAPYGHQIAGLDELVRHDRWLLGWEPGCGKSAVVAARLRAGVDACEFRRPVLIVCPKSVLSVWPDELRKHAGLRCEVMTGSPIQRQYALTALDLAARLWLDGSGELPILVTTYDHVRVAAGGVNPLFKLLAQRKLDVLVADESHRCCNKRTLQSKGMQTLSQMAEKVWALSGTPAPNGPMDWLGQLLLLDPSGKIAGTRYITHWRAKYAIMAPTTRFPKVIGYKNLPDLNKRVARVASFVRKEEALDLPEKIIAPRYGYQSATVMSVYQKLRREALVRLQTQQGAGTLTAKNVGVEINRLAQIAGGWVKDDDGKTHALVPNDKLRLLTDVLEDMDSAIIWCSFRAEVEAIYKLLAGKLPLSGKTEAKRSVLNPLGGDASGLGGGAVLFYGDSTDDERRQAIEQFQSGDVRWFVGTPQAGGLGITLTRTSNVVWYSRTYSLVQWEQATDRAHRIGQKHRVLVVPLVIQGTVEEKIGKALAEKRDLAAMIQFGAKLEDVL